MTAAVYRNTPSLSLPPTQNTAPVLEFNCLYTHHVHKKAKKWQDGMLRYHTFNKRVMVYDVPRNFIGDMHWSGDGDVHEGDEITLERSGVKVEVTECIGRTETDLSELRKSKNKPPRTAAAASTTTPPRAATATAPGPVARPNIVAPPRANTQLKHRSLNALLGTPKGRGPIGKARLPIRSPFEERHANPENERWEEGRPPKRLKTGDAWNVTRTTTTPKAARPKDVPLCARTSDAAKKKRPVLLPGQQKLGTTEIIALSDDEEEQQQQPDDFLPGFSDDALAHSSSPAKAKQRAISTVVARSSSPAFHAQRVPPARAIPPAAPPKAALLNECGEAAVARLSESDIDRSRQSDAGLQHHLPQEHGIQPKSRGASEAAKVPKPAIAEHQNLANGKPVQTLRPAASAPRRRGLLCQDQLAKKTNKTISLVVLDTSTTTPDTKESEEQQEYTSTARRRLEAHLARIDKKGGSTSSTRLNQASKKRPLGKRAAIEISSDHTPVGDGSISIPSQVEQEKVTSCEASALELGRLDDLMLPPTVPKSRRTTAIVEQTPTVMPESLLSPRPAPRGEGCSLRRAISESEATCHIRSKSKRMPGAPVRYTPSPTKRSRESTPASASRSTTPVPVLSRPAAAPAAKDSRSKKPFQKSLSLNMTSNATSAVLPSKQFKALSAKANQAHEPELVIQDTGPWSRDAFDLFIWRPPGWDEESWCVKEDIEQSVEPRNGLSGGVSFPG